MWRSLQVEIWTWHKEAWKLFVVDFLRQSNSQFLDVFFFHGILDSLKCGLHFDYHSNGPEVWCNQLLTLKPVSFSRSKLYFMWQMVMSDVEWPTSMPKKYLSLPRSIILNSTSSVILILSISSIEFPAKLALWLGLDANTGSRSVS